LFSVVIFSSGDFHFDLSFLGAQHDRLRPESSDHVERLARRTTQCQLFDVGRDASLDHFPQLRRHRKESIRRTQVL
jgi:hypothetical protein